MRVLFQVCCSDTSMFCRVYCSKDSWYIRINSPNFSIVNYISRVLGCLWFSFSNKCRHRGQKYLPECLQVCKEFQKKRNNYVNKDDGSKASKYAPKNYIDTFLQRRRSFEEKLQMMIIPTKGFITLGLLNNISLFHLHHQMRILLMKSWMSYHRMIICLAYLNKLSSKSKIKSAIRKVMYIALLWRERKMRIPSWTRFLIHFTLLFY